MKHVRPQLVLAQIPAPGRTLLQWEQLGSVLLLFADLAAALVAIFQSILDIFGGGAEE